MPSQTHWEDSYGNQKGKQEVCEEVIQQKVIEQEEHKQKESEQEGNEAGRNEEDSSEEVDRTEELCEEGKQEVQFEKVQPLGR